MGNAGYGSKANRKGIIRSSMGFEDMPIEEPAAVEGFCGSSRVIAILMLAAIFVAFTPGVLLRLGSRYGKYAVAAIHAVLFAVVLMFVYGRGALEGFKSKKEKAGTKMVGADCKTDSECASRNCKDQPRPAAKRVCAAADKKR
jgi:hypothetical protein